MFFHCQLGFLPDSVLGFRRQKCSALDKDVRERSEITMTYFWTLGFSFLRALRQYAGKPVNIVVLYLILCKQLNYLTFCWQVKQIFSLFLKKVQIFVTLWYKFRSFLLTLSLLCDVTEAGNWVWRFLTMKTTTTTTTNKQLNGIQSAENKQWELNKEVSVGEIRNGMCPI